MTDVTPAARRSPLEHERDAGHSLVKGYEWIDCDLCEQWHLNYSGYPCPRCNGSGGAYHKIDRYR